MKTEILLKNLGLEKETKKAVENALEGATAFLRVWGMEEVTPHHEEEQGQLAELILALRWGEVVEKSIEEDLSSMGEWAWEEDLVEAARHFAWLADLFLRIKEKPDLERIGEWVDQVSAALHNWRASGHLDRGWGDVVVWHLRRQGEVRWELVWDEGGWWLREGASGIGIKAYEGGPMPSCAEEMAKEVEGALKCKLYADAYKEETVPEVREIYRAAVDTVGQALLKEGLALVDLKGFDPQGEGLGELWRRLKEVTPPPGRGRLALCEAANRVLDAWCDQAEEE
jgi:hypothetical protein